MSEFSGESRLSHSKLAELEAWHQRYDDARFAGKDPDEACRVADQQGPTKRKLASVPDLSRLRHQPTLVITSKALIDPASLEFSPGAVIPLNDGAKIEFLPTASSASSTRVVSMPTSRVVIPEGVRLH